MNQKVLRGEFERNLDGVRESTEGWPGAPFCVVCVSLILSWESFCKGLCGMVE